MAEQINLVPPRTSVEIQLPDGRVLSGPRGARVGKFLKMLEYDSQLIAAVVNGDLRELTYPINIEARVIPVTMSDPDGARIYRRSLTFLLEMAFSDLFPNAVLYVDHSVASGGYYCQVTGRAPLFESEIDASRITCRSWSNQTCPLSGWRSHSRKPSNISTRAATRIKFVCSATARRII